MKYLADIAILLIAIVGIVSFVILAVGGEPVLKWIPALLLSILFAGMAILGIRLERTEK